MDEFMHTCQTSRFSGLVDSRPFKNLFAYDHSNIKLKQRRQLIL